MLEFSSHQFQIADNFLFSISFSCQILCCCPSGCGYLIIQVNITRGLWCSPFRIHPHRDSPINMPAFKATETPQTIFWAFKQEAIILLRKCSLLSRGSHVSTQHSAHAGALLLQEGSSGPQDVPYLSVSPCGTHTLLRMLHKHTQWLTQHNILVIHCKNKLLCRWLLPAAYLSILMDLFISDYNFPIQDYVSSNLCLSAFILKSRMCIYLSIR